MPDASHRSSLQGHLFCNTDISLGVLSVTRFGMRELSLARMDQLSAFFASLPDVLAVVAFGSNALRERFDDSSDLDFLVLVTPDAKANTLDKIPDLSMFCTIDAVHIAYGDAVKLLFSDGVLCDFGVVTPDQLATFPHGPGKYLWCRQGWLPVDISPREPARMAMCEHILNALFHLYTGLLRVARAEEAAAFVEIQVMAAEHVLSILEGNKADAFSPLRRAEALLSDEVLQAYMPGYGHSLHAAKAMLESLPQAMNLPLYQAVKALLESLEPHS